MAVPGTSAGLGVAKGPSGAVTGVTEGSLTTTVYTHIREGRYPQALTILTAQLQAFPRSRAALSLMAYCYYQTQDYRSAATCYEELLRYYPEVDSYKLHYAQSLYKSGLYPEATRACMRVDSDQYAHRVTQLQAAIKYEEDDLASSKALLASGAVEDDPDTLINRACIVYKEGKYAEARALMLEAAHALPYTPALTYAIALTHYCEGSYNAALKALNDIIERGVREHPQLSVGAHTDGIDVRSVGNTQTLRETALVEAFNLKAAIDFKMGNLAAAREALSDMPPRTEAELDPVTLHNSALMSMDSDPTPGFRKLNFLLSNPPFPPETFANLLMLYIKYGCADLAADVMAENAHLTFKYLTTDMYEFLDATIMVPTSPEEAFRKYDVLTSKHIETLRRHTKSIQDARLQHDGEGIKGTLKTFDEALEKYIPVLMGQARIYWDKGAYGAVERIFRQAAEFASDHETWKLNVAHTFFMQADKYREAIRYYEPLVRKKWDHLLDVTAIVLANLCVSYIMTSQNDEAEKIMARVEEEEKRAAAEEAMHAAEMHPAAGGPGAPKEKQFFHLCIINLVIGTLYCSKNNYEFGVSRIIKSLDPLSRKLGTDTWFYAKRCFLALAEGLSKHMINIRDAVFDDILTFLDAADAAGKDIPTVIAGTKEEVLAADAPRHNVSYEARVLKRLYLRLQDAV